MNILMFHPTMDIGGAPINNIALATRLQAAGHRVVFAADDGPLVDQLRARGIGYRHLATRGRGHLSLALLRDLVNAIRAEAADVVWTAGILPCLRAHLACWWSNTPLFPLHGSPNPPRFYLPRVGICGWVNPHHRDHMVRVLGWKEEDVLLIRGRMEIDAYQPGQHSARILHRFGVREGERVVALIGNIIREKWGSVELFLNAAHMLADKHPTLRFVVVGEGLAGGQAYYDRARQLAASINQRCGREAVVLTGASQQVPEVMQQAEIVAGMASTCVLSLLCGRPTIVLGNRGFSGIVTPETFDDLAYNHFNMHGVAHQKQPEVLCGQLARLLDDPPLRAQLGQWSRKTATETFDVHVGAGQLEGALRHACAVHRRDLGFRLRWLREIVTSLGSAAMYKVKGMTPWCDVAATCQISS